MPRKSIFRPAPSSNWTTRNRLMIKPLKPHIRIAVKGRGKHKKLRWDDVDHSKNSFEIGFTLSFKFLKLISNRQALRKTTRKESECAQSPLHEKCDMELFGFGAVRFLGDEISLGVEGKFRKAPLRGFPPLLLPCLSVQHSHSNHPMWWWLGLGG